ncbi:MAG: ATP-binding protein [Candidatus Omnitrophota bacterium]
MKIRDRLVILFLAVAILPLIWVGTVAYHNGRQALIKGIGQNLHQIAHEAIDKVNRSMFGVWMNIRTWSNLDILQEITIGDLDGRVTQFLMEAKKNYGTYNNLYCFNARAEMVASTRLKEPDIDIDKELWFKQALAGKPYIEDIGYNALEGKYTIIFAAPVRAAYDPQKVIGVLAASLKVESLFSVTRVLNLTEDEEEDYATHIILINGQGLVISAPQEEEKTIFKRNLIKDNLHSALRASLGDEGYLLENVSGKEAIIGYEHSGGYRDFSGLGWSALVVQDTKDAFRLIRAFHRQVWIIGLAAALIILFLAIFVANHISRPLRRLISATSKVAHGDLTSYISVDSRDEIGELAASFNQMITNLRESREELEEWSRTLEQKVSERTVELQQSKQQLEKSMEQLATLHDELQVTQSQLMQAGKMAAVGQLASGVAHEINNPLSIILNNVQLIKLLNEQGKGVDLNEIKEIVDIIQESVIRARRITQGLLDFSHISTGKFTKVSINELIKKVLSLVEYEMRMHNIAVRCKLEDSLPRINGDAQILQQVFFNLISNARWAIEKKSAKDGGIISISTRFDKDKKLVTVFISDTGVGISEEDKERIFEAFYTTKPVGEGTGLGLSIVYNIINEHKGSISVESEVGKGATFKIVFPVGDSG